MLIRFPKDDKYFSWTRHMKNKMFFYSISESKVKSVFKNPTRKEEGVAPKTSATMKRNDSKSKKEEIWVMYQSGNIKNKTKNGKTILISAWRYPGVSKKSDKIPIPDDILEALDGIL